VAVKGSVVPRAIDGLVGVTPMETSCAAVTARVVDPDRVPKVAVIVVEPTATLVASPSLPPALVTVAAAASDDDQVTLAVRSCVVVSVYTPVAVSCCVVPSAIDGLVGVTPMETSVAAVTTRVVVPVLPLRVAVIVTEPTLAPFARPGLGAA